MVKPPNLRHALGIMPPWIGRKSDHYSLSFRILKASFLTFIIFILFFRDYEIKPFQGENPFSSYSTYENGTYEIYLTPGGNSGFPNEAGFGQSDQGILIMRLYTNELVVNNLDLAR